MRPVFTDLAQDIQRSIGYYQSLNKDAQLTRLIGVGSTFQLPGLRKYLKQQLSMDVYRIENFKLHQDGRRPRRGFRRGFPQPLHRLRPGPPGPWPQRRRRQPHTHQRPSQEHVEGQEVAWFGLAAGVAGMASGVMFVRPVKDYFDVTGRFVDPVVQSSQAHAAELKKEATDAKVTTASEPDYTAANMVALPWISVRSTT